MKMGELDITTLGLPADTADFLDEEMPGWRDMTMVEFADELPKFAAALQREGQAMIEVTKQLAQQKDTYIVWTPTMATALGVIGHAYERWRKDDTILSDYGLSTVEAIRVVARERGVELREEKGDV